MSHDDYKKRNLRKFAKAQGKTTHRKATPQRNIRWDYVFPVILVFVVVVILLIAGS